MMLPGLRAMAWFLAVALVPQKHCGEEACAYVPQGDWQMAKQKTAGFEEANSNSTLLEGHCATGFKSQGAWFEAELTGCFTGGVDEETGQGFEAFGHHVGDSSAWNLTLEHEQEVNYDLDGCALWIGDALSNAGWLSIEALCIGGLSVINALSNVDWMLGNIAGWWSSVGMLNSWDEAEKRTVDLVTNRNTGRVMNQSNSGELEKGYRQEVNSMAVYMLDEEKMCLTFDDKCNTSWEGATQEFGTLQLMNKTVHTLSQQVDKLLQQMPDAGTVQELAEDFLQRLWQEMSMTRSWIAWTISLIAAWMMSHLSRCKHRQSRTKKKVFARAKQVRRKQLYALLFASWLHYCGRAMDQEMFMKMAAMTEAATKAATAAEVGLASLAGDQVEQVRVPVACKRDCKQPQGLKDLAQSRAVRWLRST